MKRRMAFFVMVLSSAAAFADNENYDGQDVSGQNFDEMSLVDSSWKGSAAGNASFGKANLTNAKFNNADLTKAFFSGTTLAGANFEGATVNKAVLNGVVALGFTKEQFYSTASYKSGDLSGILLWENDLAGWNFGGKNLTDMDFKDAVLTGANFKDATIAGVNFYGTISKGFTQEQLYSTASYKAGDLSGVEFWYGDVSGWDFKGQNLSGANFYWSTLTNANFENAIINMTNFTNMNSDGLTKEQLYSTASYKNKDLRCIQMWHNDISGWDFSGQNLMRAGIFEGNTMDNANFTKADLRGTNIGQVTVLNIIVKNTIMNDGSIENFSMKSAEDSFSIRKYENMWPHEDTKAINAKIDYRNESVSGGAKLTLEAGAMLDITDNATLEFGDGGELLVCVSEDDLTEINVAYGAGLAFMDGSILTVDVSGDFDGADTFTFKIIGWENGSRISGLDDFVMGENLFLMLNGEIFDGDWTYEVSSNDLSITFTVPEPAVFAMALGALAFGLAQWRRRL